jgi:hypothetical protein
LNAAAPERAAEKWLLVSGVQPKARCDEAQSPSRRSGTLPWRPDALLIVCTFIDIVILDAAQWRRSSDEIGAVGKRATSRVSAAPVSDA